MSSFCSLCQKKIDSENAAILTLGGYANPRYMCEECEGDFDTATLSHDITEISCAMDRISKKITASNQDDNAVLKAVKEIMENASKRAEEIKNGTYDFSEEEAEPVDEEIPEELRETEEDKEFIRKQEEANKKFDKISNWVCFGLLVGALGYLAYRFISSLF